MDAGAADGTPEDDGYAARCCRAYHVAVGDLRALDPGFAARMFRGPVTGRLPSLDEVVAAFGPPDYDGMRTEVDGEVFDLDGLAWVTMRDWFGWGIPAEETLDAVEAAAAGRPILEVGCGGGFWSACLAARGLDVVAVDDASWKRTSWRRQWIEPVRMDAAAAVLRHPDRVVLCVWPDEGLGSRLARTLPVGATLVAVAPRHCTGSDLLFASIDADFADGGRFPVPTGSGVRWTGRVLDRRSFTPDPPLAARRNRFGVTPPDPADAVESPNPVIPAAPRREPAAPTGGDDAEPEAPAFRP